MRHAYLIIYHNEYDVTKCLIEAIDDVRNDIYIHVDKKVEELPNFLVQFSNLYFIHNRIDVRWGDYSVVEAELELMRAVLENGNYSYCHLLSGVDMPLKSQNFIHSFFEKHEGQEFIGFSQYDYSAEIERKVHRYHLYSKFFKNEKSFMGLFRKGLRFIFIRVQNVLGFRMNKNILFKKGTQWVSITSDFAKYLLSKSKEIKAIYSNTFCPDEIYKQTICWSNPKFRENIYNVSDEGYGCMRMIGWVEGELKDWENKDFEILIGSDFLYARKFNSKQIEVVFNILKYIKSSG